MPPAVCDQVHSGWFKDVLAYCPGNGQYVEAKASSSGGDTCASETSTFDVEINVGTTPLGKVSITERWNQFNGSSTNGDVIKVDVGRGGDQDQIIVTVT